MPKKAKMNQHMIVKPGKKILIKLNTFLKYTSDCLQFTKETQVDNPTIWEHGEIDLHVCRKTRRLLNNIVACMTQCKL